LTPKDMTVVKRLNIVLPFKMYLVKNKMLFDWRIKKGSEVIE
jgi:hypothetical protein